MSERIGVYICQCGSNISDHVDVEKVKQAAEIVEALRSCTQAVQTLGFFGGRKVVWLRADQTWTDVASEIGVFTGDAAEAALEAARSQEGEITDPYFMEVTEDGKVAGRETLRESIRANGPTVPYGVII